MTRPPLPDDLKGYHTRRYLFSECRWEDESVCQMGPTRLPEPVIADKSQTVDAEKVEELADQLPDHNGEGAPLGRCGCDICFVRDGLLALVEGES